MEFVIKEYKLIPAISNGLDKDRFEMIYSVFEDTKLLHENYKITIPIDGEIMLNPKIWKYKEFQNEEIIKKFALMKLREKFKNGILNKQEVLELDEYEITKYNF